MEPIGKIDALGKGRWNPTAAERQQFERSQKQQEKERGYQQLVELCNLGEYNAAKQLAEKYPSWGYEVVDGIVLERLPEE